MALLLAWVYIFDTVQRERELLEGPKEGIVGAGGLQDPSQVAHTTTVFPPDREDSRKGKDEETGEMSGQAINVPPQMLVDSADGRSIGDMYAPMQGTSQLVAFCSLLQETLEPVCCLKHLHCYVLLNNTLSSTCLTVPLAAAQVLKTASIRPLS